MLNFSNASFPYFEFPERIEVILFDKNNNQTKIISDYAISYSNTCLLYTSPSPRDPKTSRMPSSA